MPKESWCWSSNTCIWGYVIMAKKCPNCNSTNTKKDSKESGYATVYYCNNCSNFFTSDGFGTFTMFGN